MNAHRNSNLPHSVRHPLLHLQNKTCSFSEECPRLLHEDIFFFKMIDRLTPKGVVTYRLGAAAVGKRTFQFDRLKNNVMD